MRTLIFGGPRTGKTTLAGALACSRCGVCHGTGLGYPETHGPFERPGDKVEFVLVEKPCACVAGVRHTDVLIGELPWSQASQHIADEWLNEPGPWIIEGVAVGRALRKWLAANPTGKPCEELIVLEVPHVELTGRQRGMAKGCATVLEQAEPELVRRGVDVRRGTR